MLMLFSEHSSIIQSSDAVEMSGFLVHQKITKI